MHFIWTPNSASCSTCWGQTKCLPSCGASWREAESLSGCHFSCLIPGWISSSSHSLPLSPSLTASLAPIRGTIHTGRPHFEGGLVQKDDIMRGVTWISSCFSVKIVYKGPRAKFCRHPLWVVHALSLSLSGHGAWNIGRMTDMTGGKMDKLALRQRYYRALPE